MAARPPAHVALFEQVLAPLVLGGPVRPLRPVGPSRAAELAQLGPTLGAASTGPVDVARVRRARLLCPLDALAPPSRCEWLMAAALSDLLQCASPMLAASLRRSRAAKLLEHVDRTLALVPPPASVQDALGRHATFARLLELERPDTHVAWWCGSETCRGREPPGRLLAWKGLRRVSTTVVRVNVVEMADWLAPVAARYQATLARLLEASPLTDLATASRERPAFRWTEASLGLVATAPGRALASRALRGAGAGRVAPAVLRATTQLQARTGPALCAPAAAVAAELGRWAHAEA